jgi:hypothetical protein
MKKITACCILCVMLYACDNKTGSSGDKDSTANKTSAIDTTQHATGITNQNVISRDTGAMRIDSFHDRKKN